MQSQVNALIALKQPGFFAKCDMPLLIELARHIARADDLAAKLTATDYDADPQSFRRLMLLGAGETNQVLTLMRALRLSPQCRYRADARVTEEDGAEVPDVDD